MRPDIFYQVKNYLYFQTFFGDTEESHPSPFVIINLKLCLYFGF